MSVTQSGYTINTYSYASTYSASDCMRHLSDLGFTSFELMLIPGHFWPTLATAAERKEIGNILTERDLQLETLNQPNLDLNLAALSPECRSYSCAVVNSAMELAADWQARAVVINPGKTNPVFPASAQALADHFRSSLDVLVPRAAQLGVQILVKNHPLSWLYKGSELLAFFDEYGWSSVGLGYDVANALYGSEAAIETLPKVAKHLSAIYVDDTTLEEFRHDPIGAGAVQFAPIASVITAIGYQGPTIMEIVSSDPDAAILHSVSELEGIGWPASA
jgi:sugar phosphate isomerase/epimerase